MKINLVLIFMFPALPSCNYPILQISFGLQARSKYYDLEVLDLRWIFSQRSDGINRIVYFTSLSFLNFLTIYL